MRRYDVVIHGWTAHPHRVHLEAGSPGEAVMRAKATGECVDSAILYAVFRHRRVGRPKPVGSFAGTGGGDGLAGIREPRRPLPDPGHLRAERRLPD